MVTVGARLKKWREARGLSQARAGELVGLRQVAWYRLENDLSAPDVALALKLEELAGIPVRAWVRRKAA